MSDPIKNLNVHQRIAKVMEAVTYIRKDKKQGMKYSVVSHDVVTAKVRPALLDAGVIYYPIKTKGEQIGNKTKAEMTIRFVNIDEPTDFIDVETFGYGVDESDKGPGKAMSYAVKYALLKTLGLETGDDPDMDQDTTYRETIPDKHIDANPFSDADKIDQTYLDAANEIINNWRNSATALKDWWREEKPHRATAGVIEGTPEFKALYDNFCHMGLTLAGNVKTRAA